MNEQRTLLADTITRLFRDALTDNMRKEAEASGWCAPLWTMVEEHGLPALFLSEDDGGFGGGMEDAALVARLAGQFAVPAPIVESMLANRLLVAAKLALPDGLTTVAVQTDLTLDGDRLRGLARAVPWARNAAHMVALAKVADSAEERLVLVPVAGGALERNVNLAAEPRDDLRFENAAVTASAAPPSDGIHDLLAVLRTAQIAGALEAALGLSIQYANDRVQFGKPIGAFQAVQQQLALMAEETAAIVCAAGSACRAAEAGGAEFEIAAAKLRANRAVDVAQPIAHQVHGAIGFTEEHSLRRWTQRMLSWRSECGGDRYWARRLGTLVVARGPDRLWPDLTERGEQ
jgi:acyl-CoA dehydrogenase